MCNIILRNDLHVENLILTLIHEKEKNNFFVGARDSILTATSHGGGSYRN